MARIGDQVQVKISDRGVEGGKRKLSVEVEASERLFYLSDALMREGIVRELSTELRATIRNGIVSYVQQGREMIRKLGEAEKSKENGKAR